MMGSWHRKATLLTEIRDIREILEHLRIERDAAQREVGLVKESNDLRKEIEKLKIERDRLTEKHAREEREIKHMVGLEKRRQEVEITQAKKDTVLTVREENLAAERQRFEDQMKFQNERFAKEVGYLKEIMSDILNRLPTVTVDKQVKGRA